MSESSYLWNTLNDYKWIILIFLVCIGVYWMRPSGIEGFADMSNLSDTLKMHTCHGVTRSIKANKTLLAGYIERDAVTSAENTEEFLNLLTKASDNLDCETLIQKHPVPDVIIPDREEVLKAALKDVMEKHGLKKE